MKNKKIIILISIILLILVFILSVIFSLLNMNNNNIFSGITIDNINVSKMSKEDANSILSDLISKKIDTEIKLKYSKDENNNSSIDEPDNKNQDEITNNTYETTLNLSSLDIQYDILSSTDEAYNLGRIGNIFQNNFTIAKALFNGKNLDINISLDEDLLENIISDISSNLPGKIIHSSYYIEDGNLIITKGSPGITVDKEMFIASLKKELNNISSTENCIEIPVKYVEPDAIDLDQIHSEIYKDAKNAYFEKDPFEVYTEVTGVDFDVEKAKNLMSENPDDTEYTITLQYTNPEIKLSDLDIDIFPDLLGTFSTKYDASNKERSNNLNLAASKINGTILSPGEEFSYNKIVGERTIEAGYKEAKIYSNGEVVDGIGGGICQISSTLYNSVVFANLEVTKRYNHQFVTSYVSPGRDATVVYGAKDFKFINNRTYPIKIEITVNSGIAKVDIYGIKEETEYDISFDIETISNIPYDTKYKTDSSLPAGTEQVKQIGANGIIVNAYKIIKQNGITIARELISKDTYNALDRVILKSSN